MNIIKRPEYYEKLKKYLSAPAVTVITGMRRVGKSVLMRQLRGELEGSGNIVYIDKESMDFDHIKKAKDLVDNVAQAAPAGEIRYVFVDEVQQIEEWQRAIASLHAEENTSIVISGSNADMLSGDLADRLSGRYISLPVYPLSLKEYSRLYNLLHIDKKDKKEIFRLYLKTGGLPGLLHTDLSDDVCRQMQRDIFNTIAVKDIISRYRIRDVGLFEAVMTFAMDNIGSLTSAKRISDFLKKERRSLSVDSVLNYLRFMKDGHLLYSVQRYDLRGKRLLEINEKYYLGDTGLRNGFIGYRKSDISGILENLVYIELLRRGYRVRIGTLPDSEIDFIAEKDNMLHYIQVSYLLESRDTLERELAPLRGIHDQWAKTLLTLDEFQPPVFEGIRHRSIIDFLMGQKL